MSVKKSVGLCLIRYRPEQTRLVPEVLLVCKRYTYAYFDFIYGKCKNSRATLDKMTADEKFDILSGDFERMWYRIWFNHPKPPTYMMIKNRFEAKYMLDGGKRLRAEIEQSVNSPRLWDIPKGRKQPRESDVVCAVRELSEETGVSRRLYNIVPGITLSTSHTTFGYYWPDCTCCTTGTLHVEGTTEECCAREIVCFRRCKSNNTLYVLSIFLSRLRYVVA